MGEKIKPILSNVSDYDNCQSKTRQIQKLIQFEIIEPNQIFFHKMQMFAPLGIHLHPSRIVIFCDEYLKFMYFNCVLKQFHYK